MGSAAGGIHTCKCINMQIIEAVERSPLIIHIHVCMYSGYVIGLYSKQQKDEIFKLE